MAAPEDMVTSQPLELSNSRNLDMKWNVLPESAECGGLREKRVSRAEGGGVANTYCNSPCIDISVGNLNLDGAAEQCAHGGHGRHYTVRHPMRHPKGRSKVVSDVWISR